MLTLFDSDFMSLLSSQLTISRFYQHYLEPSLVLLYLLTGVSTSMKSELDSAFSPSFSSLNLLSRDPVVVIVVSVVPAVPSGGHK